MGNERRWTYFIYKSFLLFHYNENKMNNYLQFPFISFHSSNSRSKHNLASHYHETKNYYLRFKVYAYLLRDKILFCGKKIQIVVKMLLCETSLSGVEKERSKTNQKQAKLVLRHNMRYISLMRAELHKKCLITLQDNNERN